MLLKEKKFSHKECSYKVRSSRPLYVICVTEGFCRGRYINNKMAVFLFVRLKAGIARR